MSELLLRSARIVTRDEVFTGTVRALDGTIADVTRGETAGPGGEDLDGDYLVPGVVELHTDVLERHAGPRPGVRWPDVAAVLAYDAALATGGITTVLDSLAVGYVIDNGQRPRNPRLLVDAVRAAQTRELLRAEHFLHLRCEVSTEFVLEDFAPFAGDPSLRLVSLMDHTPGQRQFVSMDTYRAYNQGRYGLSEAELDALVARRLEDRDRFGAPHRAGIVALCQKHGHPLASHDDATVEHVEEAVQAGTAIAEFPTTVEAARAAHEHGLAIVAGAPNLVLGRSHSGNVSVGDLARLGMLDILSSDYVPSSALHGAFLLASRYGIPLPQALATVSLTPARRVGLDDRGEIAPGKSADLVRVTLTDDLPVVRAVWRLGRRIA